MRFFLMILVLAVVGCGEAPQGGGDGGAPKETVEENPLPAIETTPDNFAMAVPTESDRPPCNNDNKYRLVYVKSLAAFHTCDGNLWSTIDLKGKDGNDGQDGASGANGTNGMSIKSIYGCQSSSTNLDAGSNLRYGSGAYITEFSDGSYFMTCDSSILYQSPSDIDRSSSSIFYPRDSAGVKGGSIECAPYYVSHTYVIAAKTVTYRNQADSTKHVSVICTQAYVAPTPTPTPSP